VVKTPDWCDVPESIQTFSPGINPVGNPEAAIAAECVANCDALGMTTHVQSLASPEPCCHTELLLKG
jgi:hypothetical protein